MDDTTRTAIADALDELASQETWNEEVWRRCYSLVDSNVSNDELIGHVFHDLVHYSGRRLFRSAPIPADFKQYRQEFRDIASALRLRMSLADYLEEYE